MGEDRVGEKEVDGQCNCNKIGPKLKIAIGAYMGTLDSFVF